MAVRRGLCVLGCLLLIGAEARAQTSRPAATEPAGQRIDLLAVGDWEYREGNPPTTGRAMAEYVAASGRSFQAALLLGDSFHVHLKKTGEPNLERIFEATYDARRLSFPFYAILGNHDCEADNTRIEMAYAAEHPKSRWKLPGPWYRLDLPAKEPLVTVLMLNSNDSKMSPQDWQAQRQWMDAELDKPRAPWTICGGHHPLFSNGMHGDDRHMQKDWGPILTKHRVDFYLCGHEHALEHLEVDGWPTAFLVIGGGGGRLRSEGKTAHGPFSRVSLGFVHLAMDRKQATVRFIDGAGNLLHEFTRQVAPTKP
jgi:tartrate-resistant acid phosphatase type 5